MEIIYDGIWKEEKERKIGRRGREIDREIYYEVGKTERFVPWGGG